MLGGRKANVLGGRLPIKDQFQRKVREAQERYCGLLGRGSLLYKNLLYAFFFSSEKHRGCGIFNQTAKWGEEAEQGSGAARREGPQCLPLDGRWFICTLYEFLK